jgi:hypothetical protein
VVEVAVGEDDGGRPGAGAEPPRGRAGDVAGRAGQAGIDQHPAPVAGARPANEGDIHHQQAQAGDLIIWPAAFRRGIALPYGVEADKVHASSSNGVLTLTLPKAEAAKPKRIQVQTQAQPRLTSQAA